MAGGENPIKPGHRAIKAYYEELARYANQDVKHETAVRSAFQNLLADAAKKRRWTLVPELADQRGGPGRIVPDGTVRDEFLIPRGYWEAKDRPLSYHVDDPDNNVDQVLRCITLLDNLIAKVEDTVRQTEGMEEDVYLEHFLSIRKGVLFPNLDTIWQEVQKHLTPTVVESVKYCAARLAEVSPESPIKHATLEELQEDIAKLFDTTSKAAINEDLRRALLDLLEMARRAVFEYRFRGAEGLNEVLTFGVGTLCIRKVADPATSQCSEFEEAWKLLCRIEAVVRGALAYTSIAWQGIDKLLLSNVGWVTTHHSYPRYPCHPWPDSHPSYSSCSSYPSPIRRCEPAAGATLECPP